MRRKHWTYASLISGSSGIAAALAVLLLSPAPAVAADRANGSESPMVLLLSGVYQPAVNVPDIGLSTVNLNDGTFSTTQIHTVNRVPGGPSEDDAAIGHFYVQFNGSLAAYDLPGGAIAMQFTAGGFPTVVQDGHGGVYLEGTFELTIIEATGIYKNLVGGHNHMVDRLHRLASGQFDESCFCIISAKGSLPIWWTSDAE